MFDKWFKLPAHLYLRLTALVILTVGVTLSNVLMSIGAIWIISNWIIEADYQNYWKRLKRRKSLWFLLFIFFFGLLSVIWSENVGYWFRDARMKLPLLAVPLVMATSTPLKKEHFHFLLFVFFGMLTYTTVWNYGHYLSSPADDIREMSRFISHVRLATLLVLGIFMAIFCLVKNTGNRLLLTAMVLWFLFYLYKSQVLNGYLLLAVVAGCSVVYALTQISNRRYRLVAAVVLGTLTIGTTVFFVQLLSTFTGAEEVQRENLPVTTENGNDYYHNFDNKTTENGHYVWINMCQFELEQEWNLRSEIAYDSTDRKGQPMFGTLMRYLTSKGWRKDSVAVWNLSEDEVERIENGTTSAVASEGIKARLQAFVHDYELYQQGGDPNGHSLMQRLEHLKTAVSLLKKHWLFGVGTGDLNDVFQEEYDRLSSRLTDENRWRSHNQFLSIWIALGILGLLAFVLAFVFAVIENKHRDYFMIIVLISLFVSCLFQDVLETQAGITIFSLFFSLAVYREI